MAAKSITPGVGPKDWKLQIRSCVSFTLSPS